MRDRPAGRMLSLTAWMLAGLVAMSGCKSTSTPGNTLAKDSIPSASQTHEIAWKRAAPSTAMAQDHWTNPLKQDDPLRTTAFQEPPSTKPWTAPPPQIGQKDPHEMLGTVIVPPPPVLAKHTARHHGKAPLALPDAAGEGRLAPLDRYRIRPPDVLLIELAPNVGPATVLGQHLVRPDGTVSLGSYGDVFLWDKTLEEARNICAAKIFERLEKKEKPKEGEVVRTLEDVKKDLKVDVLTYNSSVYYVITNLAGAGGVGELVERLPITGNETVLDAISNIRGLSGMTSPKRIFLVRPGPGPTGAESILPIDWKGITQRGQMATNWQIMPGDRIYLQADPVRRFDNNLARVLSPLQRVLSVGQQVNALRNGNNNTNLIAPPAP